MSSRNAPSRRSTAALLSMFVNSTRTQNGHIRNDTHDVARPILESSLSSICQEKRVADDPACTRVTLSNFHGKEVLNDPAPECGRRRQAESVVAIPFDGGCWQAGERTGERGGEAPANLSFLRGLENRY